VRTFTIEVLDMIEERMREVATHTAAAFGVRCEFEFVRNYPPTINAAHETEFARRVMASIVGEQHVLAQEPTMGAEDFAYVLEKVPGAMFFLGASHEGDDWRSCCGLHSNRMVLDDSVMARGAALHAAIAERYLAQGFAG
jgi:hippurate hydrolase